MLLPYPQEKRPSWWLVTCMHYMTQKPQGSSSIPRTGKQPMLVETRDATKYSYTKGHRVCMAYALADDACAMADISWSNRLFAYCNPALRTTRSQSLDFPDYHVPKLGPQKRTSSISRPNPTTTHLLNPCCFCQVRDLCRLYLFSQLTKSQPSCVVL